MQIKWIKENNLSKNNFARIIPFFDNPKVLNEIQRIRDVVDIKVLIPYQEYEKWFDDKISSSDKAALIWQTCDRECANILQKYGRQDINYQTLWKAAVCGEITDDDCAPCYVEIIYPDLQTCIVPKLSITFTTETNKEELIDVFEREKDRYIKEYLKYQVGQGSLVKNLIADNVNVDQLNEQRRFYLAHMKNELSYQEIADKLDISKRKFNKTEFDKINNPSHQDEVIYKRPALEYVRSKIDSYRRRVDNSIRLD